MALFLDSADLQQARLCQELGLVHGATTNPALIARAGHRQLRPALEGLCACFPGPVFHQLREHSPQGMQAEAEQLLGLAPNLGLKIMCTLPGLQFASGISSRWTVAITGVFSPSQAYLAAQAGAAYVIPYVNRIARFIGDAPGVIRSMADVLFPTGTQLLAASIKSPQEAVETLLAGAENISLPLNVMREMADHELTRQAAEAFDAQPTIPPAT